MKKVVSLITTFIIVIGICSVKSFALGIAKDEGVSCNTIRLDLEAIDSIKNNNIDEWQRIAEQEIADLINYNLVDPYSKSFNIEGIDSQGNLLYSTDIGGIQSTISVEESADGSLELGIAERSSGKYDDVRIETDGTLSLNGEPVEITILENGAFSLNSPAVTSYTKSPQYGKSSDYSKYIKTIKTANVSMKQKFASITVGALTTIVVTYLTQNLSFAKQVCSGVASGIASGLLSTGKKYAPNSAYFSCIVKKYGLSDSKKPVSAVGTFYCFKGIYYVKTNYKGSSYSYTCYENKYPTPGV